MGEVMSDIKRVNCKAPRTDPCGTPLVTRASAERQLPIHTLNILSDKKAGIQASK